MRPTRSDPGAGPAGPITESPGAYSAFALCLASLGRPRCVAQPYRGVPGFVKPRRFRSRVLSAGMLIMGMVLFVFALDAGVLVLVSLGVLAA